MSLSSATPTHVVLVLACLALAACDARQNLSPPDLDLNRMRDQPRYDVWEASPFFPNGSVMQTPPEGTVSRDAATPGPTPDAFPMPLTPELLANGRRRFETYCAPCHGVDGSGHSVIADNMPLVKPPSFHSETLRALTPGRVFQVISEGYGMMPRYAYQLDPDERWAVVAWVRALQRSRAVRLSDLPPDLRRRALEELP